jgi:hypothetical protein
VVSFSVVMCDKLSEEVPKVSLADDDEVVEAFGADGPDEAFRELHCARHRRRDR